MEVRVPWYLVVPQQALSDVIGGDRGRDVRPREGLLICEGLSAYEKKRKGKDIRASSSSSSSSSPPQPSHHLYRSRAPADPSCWGWTCEAGWRRGCNRRRAPGSSSPRAWSLLTWKDLEREKPVTNRSKWRLDRRVETPHSDFRDLRRVWPVWEAASGTRRAWAAWRCRPGTPASPEPRGEPTPEAPGSSTTGCTAPPPPLWSPRRAEGPLRLTPPGGAMRYWKGFFSISWDFLLIRCDGDVVCGDPKALWGTFVICDNGLYKINWIELKI